MSQQPIEANVKSEFHNALLALHGDIETMKKDEKNPFFKSKYVALPKMIKTLKPIMQKHGFILSQPTDVANTQTGIVNVVFSTIVHAKTGLSDTAKLALSPELIKDGSMQGLGGAITYARRYTLSALLGIEEADDDGNVASGKVVKRSTVQKQDQF